MTTENHLSILGGGLAGLAVGHFARRRGLQFCIYEAGAEVGGNCRTFQRGEFRFDSGAHRFHDKDPTATAEVRSLLGEELHRVAVPSVIYHQGTLIDFPLSPLNLLRRLGPRKVAKAACEVVLARCRNQPPTDNLEAYAVGKYGRTIASLFLLNYSQKLWGLQGSQISPHATGKRLNGLTLKTFILEALAGRLAKTQHLDGQFLYPAKGIGRIAERLRDSCGQDNIRLRSRITKLIHDGQRIQALEVNGGERIAVQQVVATLPLNVLVHSLEPPLPRGVLHIAAQLRFRSLILVALFLDIAQITRAGTVYFPGLDFPFTRVYEPKNRSAAMAPPRGTALVAEIPCDERSPAWKASDQQLVASVQSHLERLGWIRAANMLDTWVTRLPHAYPVLEKGIEAKAERVLAYLNRFQNLRCCGRNATFQHASMHELIRQARDTLESMEQSR